MLIHQSGKDIKPAEECMGQFLSVENCGSTHSCSHSFKIFLGGNRQIVIQETTESKFVATFSIDSLQSLCWAVLEPRQIDISIQYLHRHLDGQAGNREVLFCQPRVLPNEMLPAHSAAEIAGRVHFVRVTSSPPLFLLSFRLPTTPFTVDLFSCLEKSDIIPSSTCFVQTF